MRERDGSINDYEGQVAALREQVKMKEQDIADHEKTIAELRAKIEDLQS